MSSFYATLLQAGLRPRVEVERDGRIHRCSTETKPGKRNGWYVLHPDGRGAWGDWGSGSGQALGHWTDGSAEAKPIDPAVLARQRERERAHRLQAIRSAREFWQRARPLNRPHPYLERKGLSQLGCIGLRQHDGLLVVPVHWRGHLMSVQTITAEGVKRFWPGAPVKAGSHEIQRRRPSITVLCEGLATGLAVFQAMPLARVIVAFDAGNLLPVVQEVKPAGSVVIAADNDWGTQARRGTNPGREKAANAAELIGCGVAWPEGIEGTDFADMLAELGQGAHRKVERTILASARYVMAGAA